MNRVRPDVPLSGIGVLVTRPAAQSATLADALQALGAHPYVFPALAILPLQDSTALATAVAQLNTFDLAIFISPSAAKMGLAAVPVWPASLPVAAVGNGTAKALQARGIQHVITPQGGADSEHLLEHLLALPELQNMVGRRIAIFRGETGRETLAETLRSRGAEVVYIPCYRRGLPENIDAAPILSALSAGQIHAVTVFSSETLDNLITLLGKPGEVLLHATPLFVPHPRIAEHAQGLGFQKILACHEFVGEVASDGLANDITACLVEYFSHD